MPHTRTKRYQSLCLGISTGIAMLSSGTAHAEQAHDASSIILLPEVSVTETYRHTATKSLLPPEETPQSVSVIDSHTLEIRDADSINEALRYVSGVTTELRGGAVSRVDQFNIRGFPNYQNAYDGLPLLYNGWNLQPQVDAIAVEQVEIFKGPTSSLYGNMPPGGFVNLISKQPSQQSFNQVGIALGTNSLKEISVESRGQIQSSDLSYSVVGLARKRDGQAVTSEEERQVFAPSVDWQVSDKTLVNLNLYYQKDPSAGVYNTVPAAGSVFDTPYGRLDTDFYAGDANWNTYDRTVTMPGYKVNHEFESGWTLLHQARYMDAEVYQENTYNTGLLSDAPPPANMAPNADRLLLRRAYLTDETSKGLTVDNQLAGKFHTGTVEHNLLVGVDYQDLSSDVRYEDWDQTVVPPIDLYNPDHHLIDPNTLVGTTPYTSDFTIESDQVGFYLQDQLRVDNWIALIGGRYDQYNYTEKGTKYGAPATSEIDQSEFSGRMGILYEFDNGMSPYLSYAQSFEPTGGSDRNGNTFDPATADQWELGLKYNSPDQSNQFRVAAFHITKKNDLTRDPNGGPYDLIQAGETRSQGVELESRHIVNDNLAWTFNYTWIDVEVTKDNSGLEGKTPVWVADQTASFWLDYAFFEGLMANTTFSAGARYVGETQMDALNTDTVPSYTVFDLAISREIGAAVIRLSANNITDERYYSCYDSNNCWFGAERSVELGLSYQF
ncbi:MAG: TonB-dependent siderophore receptor [Gammaproteobacteria bacterium]|nr:TonB-dependent siderophore receptor [Gammaproteobacteria bacterium]